MRFCRGVETDPDLAFQAIYKVFSVALRAERRSDSAQEKLPRTYVRGYGFGACPINTELFQKSERAGLHRVLALRCQTRYPTTSQEGHGPQRRIGFQRSAVDSDGVVFQQSLFGQFAQHPENHSGVRTRSALR